MQKKCHKCYTENLDSALFCKECGTPFEIVCPQCKRVCNNDMRLCDECGTPLHPKKSINRSLYKVCGSIVVLVLIVVLFPTIGSCLSRVGLTKKTVYCPMDQYNRTEIKYGNSITDYDGNTYKTVIIGNCVWMAENMRTTHDNDGNLIAIGGKKYMDEPLRYYPDNDISNVEKYGYLYNRQAAENICPEGWHIPKVEAFPGYHLNFCHGGASKMAKSLASNYDWEPGSYWRNQYDKGSYSIIHNPASNNSTGFSAIPAGFVERYPDGFRNDDFGHTATFWAISNLFYGESPTDKDFKWWDGQSSIVMLDSYASEALILSYPSCRNTGCSVRCVRDEPAR